MTFRCKAFGCKFNQHCYCDRCGTWLYDGEVLQENCWFALAYKLMWKWKQNRWKRCHKCEVCGQVMYYTEDYCCSKDCYDEWIPF